nr:oligosaccharide flippase family protein [Bacillus sp. FJAT-47783]
MLQSYIVRNVLTVLTFDLISKMLSILITVILIRSLTKMDYAYFTFLQAVATLFVGIVASGLVASYIRFDTEQISRISSDNNKLYVLNFKLITYVYIFLIVIALIFKDLLMTSMSNDESYYSFILFGIILAYTMSICRLNIGYYQTRDKFKESGKLLNLNNVTIMLLITMLILLGTVNIYTVSIVYIVGFLSIAIVGTLKIYKKKPLNKGKHFIDLKEYYHSSFWLIFYYVMIGIFSKLDVFMITNFLGHGDIANYGVANKYYLLMLTLLPSIKAVLMVRTSKIDMIDNLESQKKFTLQWIFKSAPFILIFSTIVFLLSDKVLPILNGEIYNDSIIPFKIFVVGMAFSYIFAPNVDVLRSMKKYKALAVLGLLACVMNFVLNLYFIPIYGINGAALTTILSQIFINISSTVLVVINTRDVKAA